MKYGLGGERGIGTASILAVTIAITPAAAIAKSEPTNIAAPADAEQQSHADDITVTATRSPIKVVNAPVTVTVIDARQIEDTLTDDIKNLVRFEPGVSVRSEPSRFTAALGSTGRDGNAGFNIRGLDGNRVLIQTDGIRLPDAFAFGAQEPRGAGPVRPRSSSPTRPRRARSTCRRRTP